MKSGYYTFENSLSNFSNIFSQEEAKKYQDIWKKYLQSEAKHEHSIVIILTGASGVGKSTICLELAHILGARHIIPTDVVRRGLRASTKKEDYPALFLITHACWKAYSDIYSVEAHVKGFKEQCSFIAPHIAENIKEAIGYGKITIVEGLHALPSQMPQSIKENEDVLHFVINVPSAEKHQELYKNRANSTYFKSCSLNDEAKPVFEHIRALNNFFVKEGETVNLIANLGTKQVLSDILKVVFKRVEEIIS